MIRRLLLSCLLLVVAMIAIGRFLVWQREPVEVPSLSPQGEWTVFLQTRSGRTHLLDTGQGEVLLLLHGSGRGVVDWQQGFAARLARRFRVIGFDNYGFGYSDRGHGLRYGNAHWEQQAIDVLDALGIEKAIVMGHSAGGVVAATLAADHPDRVRGAVFVGHGMAMDPAQILPFLPGLGEMQMGRTEVFGCTDLEAHCRELKKAYRVAGTRAALLTFIRRQYTIDGLRLLWGTYEQISAPVLQVHGSQDASIPVEAAKTLGRRIADARMVVLNGAPHDVHLYEPERLAEEIEAFADGLP